MPVTREQFEQGLTYEQYKAQMTRNREKLEANERRMQIDPADLAAFQRVPHPLNVLVLAEDWCGDVIANLPVVGRLAAESGTLELRILLRDQHLDIMDQYLLRGQFRAIPAVIFLDQDFNDVGVWIERPDSVTARREEQRRALYAQHPELGSPDAPVDQLPEEARLRVQQAIQEQREQMVPFANSEVVRELREIVQRIPSAA
jgi:hypothetical protein